MKVVVISDTHGYDSMIDYVMLEEKDADLFIHCGDICSDIHDYPNMIIVRGNNDYHDFPDTKIIEIEGHRIAICHSHQFYYLKKQEKMVQFAKSNHCEMLCFGHTHVAVDEYVQGIHFFNPGSLYHSRDGRGKSYGILHISKEDIKTELLFLEK